MTFNLNTLTIKDKAGMQCFSKRKDFRREMVNRVARQYFISYEHYKNLYFTPF